MTATWEKKGTNDGVLSFDIPQEEIQKGLTKTFNKVRKNLTVPGFRKGKISRQVFNRMYGEASLYEDTLNDLLPTAYEAAVQEAGIDPVSQPKIDIVSMEAAEPWKLTAEVIVKPEVKLGKYKDLTVPKQDREVTEKDVEDRLIREQTAMAELVLKEDEPAAKGDTVVIDFEGFLNGEPFEGGKAENHSLELGSGSFIPGFEDQLIGHKAGEELEVKVTFPEDYQAKDLAGQEAIFKVKIHEVKAKELPKLDDEFAKDVDDGVATLDELKKKYHTEIAETKEKAAQEAVEDAAIKGAVDNAEIVDLPQVMIDEEVKRSMDEFFNNMQRQGINPEMYYQITGTKEEDLKKQMEGEAEGRVKTNLVLEAVAAAEDLQATDEDVEKEIKTLSEQFNMPADQIKRILTTDMLKHDIVMKQAADIVTSSAQEEK